MEILPDLLCHVDVLGNWGIQYSSTKEIDDYFLEWGQVYLRRMWSQDLLGPEDRIGGAEFRDISGCWRPWRDGRRSIFASLRYSSGDTRNSISAPFHLTPNSWRGSPSISMRTRCKYKSLQSDGCDSQSRLLPLSLQVGRRRPLAGMSIASRAQKRSGIGRCRTPSSCAVIAVPGFTAGSRYIKEPIIVPKISGFGDSAAEAIMTSGEAAP
jgi:hypothetical protein